MANNDGKNRIQPSVFTTTLLLFIAVFVLFNFNFDIFNAGAVSGPISGEGISGFITKWIPNPPTLIVSFVSSPSSINLGQSTNLSTLVEGTAVGEISYNIWWNCTYNPAPGTETIAGANTACGALTNTCANGAIGQRCDNQPSISGPPANTGDGSRIVPYTYLTSGSKRPIVIVQRNGLTRLGLASTGVAVANTPTISNMTVKVFNSRFCGQGVHATVEGTYNNLDGDAGDAFEVLINGGPDIAMNPNTTLPNSEWESGTVPIVIANGSVFSRDTTAPCNNSFVDASPQLECQMIFNNPLGSGVYTAWARVRSSVGVNNWSQWVQMAFYSNNGAPPSAATSWATPVHSFPNANFTYAPTSPAIGLPVTFTDTSSFCNGGSCGAVSTGRSWAWTFAGGSPATANNQGPHNITYNVVGIWTAGLTVTDNVGSCSISQDVNTQRAVPRWREIAPR